jgi:hypothetical protein
MISSASQSNKLLIQIDPFKDKMQHKKSVIQDCLRGLKSNNKLNKMNNITTTRTNMKLGGGVIIIFTIL